MKKALAVFLGLIALCIAGIVAVFALPTSTDSVAGSLMSDAKAAVTNVAIDASGIKEKIKTAISDNTSAIAAATGLSTSEVDAAVEKLDIDSWQATTLPASAQATGTVAGTYSGVSGTITTYADPSYITVEAYGQTVTLEVPESAQSSLAYLEYLQ